MVQYSPLLIARQCETIRQHALPFVNSTPPGHTPSLTLFSFLAQTCYDTGTNKDCIKADEYCTENVQDIYDHSNRSYYDIRTTVEVPSTYVSFLNQTSTRELIGAKPWYQECADAPGAKFDKTGDE